MHHKLLPTAKSFSAILRDTLRGKCFCIRNFISALTKNMCLSKEELDAIAKRVEQTKEGEEKFRQWENVIPSVKDGIQALKDEVTRLDELNKIYTSGIMELYKADINNDTQTKADIFARFGLPHILKQI